MPDPSTPDTGRRLPLTPTQEEPMERPDLCEFATRAKTLAAAADEFRDALGKAYDAALGEVDPETDEETVPANGDAPELFEEAKKLAGEASWTLGRIIDVLATQQGYREFEDRGVEVDA